MDSKLFLLDGMAMLYRSHYAFYANPLRDASGQNVSAIFGFLSAIQSICQQAKPTHFAVTLDTSEPTSRHELFSDYKANRQAMPEELSLQMPLVPEVLRALNIPLIRMPGYEADDIIGTLAKKAQDLGNIETFMVTPDKDYCQLVDERTKIWKPGRKGSEHEILDVSRICEDWCVKSPRQVIDVLALMGDTADNIPGIPGVGEKTAKKWISTYGSLEKLIQSQALLKGRQRELVATHAEMAKLSYRLVTIIRDVPIELDLNSMRFEQPDWAEFSAICQKLGFRTLEKRFRDLFDEEKVIQSVPEISSLNEFENIESEEEKEVQPLATIQDIKHEYQTILSAQERQELAQKLAQEPLWSFDIETTGLDESTCELLGVSFAIPNSSENSTSKAWFVAVNEPRGKKERDEVLEDLAPAFASNARKIGHNVKYDLLVLKFHGCAVSGVIDDTMLMHALIDPAQRHNMDYLAESLLNYKTIHLSEIAPKTTAKNLDMRAIPLDALGEYAAEDADVTMRLYEVLWEQLEKVELQKLYIDIERPLLRTLVNMEFEGVSIEPKLLKTASDHLAETLNELQSKIYSSAGSEFNLNSPRQVGEVFFDQLKLVAKPKKTKKGQYVTDEETLSSLAPRHKIVADLLAFREAAKLKGTYLDALPKHISPTDGRIHTRFLQLATVTGRLASQEPNLQNIPIRTEAGRDIRRAFVPKDENHVLISADYSQIELRIMAAMSGDKNMMDAFRLDRDIHRETAAALYGVSLEEVTDEMRRAAKTVNFSIIYGVSAFGLANRLGVSRSLAADFIQGYFQLYPGVKDWMEKTIQQARDEGFVSTICGRKRILTDIHSRNANLRSAAERYAINTPVQGTAADMIKLAMIRVDDWLQNQFPESKLILQIHDELIVESPKNQSKEVCQGVVKLMKEALILPGGVPILVEAKAGANWAEAH